MASISAPRNPMPKVSAEAAEVVVLIGPTDGSAPSSGDEVDWLIPLSVGTYANGGRDDIIMLQMDLQAAEKRMVDTTVPVGFKRQVEVRLMDDQGESKRVLSWGFISRFPQTIDDRREGMTLEARLDQHVFGDPLTDHPVWDPTHKLLHVERPLIFNPEIDEIVEGNMSDTVYEPGDDPDAAGDTQPWRYFLDPESMRTAQAQELQDQHASLWTLPEAVFFLCWWLNPEQKYIKNPSFGELAAALDGRDDLIKNRVIPLGLYLPAALDQLLIPAEYGWHLVHSVGGDGQRETRMRFYSRGIGVTRQLLMQRPKLKVSDPPVMKSMTKTNVCDYNVTYSLVDLANTVLVFGDYEKVEHTFLLQKGWQSSYDHISLDELERGQPGADTVPYVGRKWVLNEAGDYIGLRPEITDPWDEGQTLFGGKQSFRRRKFEQCLSQHLDGDDTESNRFRVEWWDINVSGAVTHEAKNDPGWTKVKWPFSVLEKECGIMFEGATPPDAMWSQLQDNPATVHVRITATLRGDKRVYGFADRRPQSPNGLQVALVIDMGRKFQKSKVLDSSIFSGSANTARNDTTKIKKYAESVRDIEDCAQVSCSIALEGISHDEYQLGNLIDKVNGRNLTLNGYSGLKTRFPQIVGFNFHLNGQQKLELLMESFKEERPEVLEL